MWPVVGIVVTAVLIAVIEAPRLVRKRMYKELGIFAVLLSFGLAVSVANAFKLPLPNPLNGISAIFEPVGKMLFNMLK